MSTPVLPYRHQPDPDTLHVVCRKCGSVNGACSLRCPTLNLPAGYRFERDQEATS